MLGSCRILLLSSLMCGCHCSIISISSIIWTLLCSCQFTVHKVNEVPRATAHDTQSRVTQSCPQSRVTQSCPQSRVTQSCPQSRVTQSCPQSRVTQSCPQSRVTQSCPQWRCCTPAHCECLICSRQAPAAGVGVCSVAWVGVCSVACGIMHAPFVVSRSKGVQDGGLLLQQHRG